MPQIYEYFATLLSRLFKSLMYKSQISTGGSKVYLTK